MGNNEVGVPPKSEKTSSPAQGQDQPTTHPYPDWAAVQAYYGPGMVPPYFGTAVAPGHAPHPYMWSPQPMIPPFGSPYTAIYPHGVYPHPAVPLGPHAQCPGVVPSATASEAVVVIDSSLEISIAQSIFFSCICHFYLGLCSHDHPSFCQMVTPLSMEMPKPAGNREKLPTKRLKVLNGQSTCNGNTESTGGADGNAHSQSEYNSAEGSSDGSDGNNVRGVSKGERKQSSEDIQPSDNGKTGMQDNPVYAEEVASNIPLGITSISVNIVGKLAGSGPSPSMPPTMEAGVANTGKLKAIATPVPPIIGSVLPARSGVPPELWMQDDRELKRERRKQSNRESARRSRLRKQAETEELAVKVESLNAENMTLRSEINRLTEHSDKLRLENSALVEKLKGVQSSQAGDLSLGKLETDRVPPTVAGNFLSMIDNRTGSPKEDENKEKPAAKLHQLLDSSPRTNAVAAS